MASRFPSMRLVLGLLLATVFLPLSWLLLQANADQRTLSATSARQQATAVVASAAVEQNQRLRSARTTLADLTGEAVFGSANPAACRNTMRRAAVAVGGGTHVAAMNARGVVSCASTAAEEGADLADQGFYRRAVSGRGFVLGIYRRPATPFPSLVAALAVYRSDGSLRGVLAADLDLTSLGRSAGAAALPGQSVLAMIDADGTILYRSKDASQYVGRRGPPAVRARFAANAKGSFSTVGLDGVERLNVFQRLQTGGTSRVTLVAGIPASAVYAQPNQIGRRNLLTLAATFAIALLMWSVVASKLILTPVRRISEAAQRVAGGDLSARTQLRRRRGELGALADAFDRTAAAVEARETQMRDARRREVSLQDELQQTRRLESVGQLAGGIAHDFNNLLAVIINYAQFMVDDLPAGSPSKGDAEEIRDAGTRGAALTRQLLIFSRREVVNAVVIDLNDVILGLEKLLRGSLGEHIDLQLQLTTDAPRITADPGHIEQVLVNLAVNARDAMPDGGTLIVSTAPLRIDERDADQYKGLPAGSYAVLAITDTGQGMTAEVAGTAFDPFFTTKPKGEGTGLGLATVWGIVNDLAGRVLLYSEPGLGTSVKIYLPATQTSPAVVQGAGADLEAGHGEMVLVVEDEPAVRRLAERILTGAGYAVSVADGADQAMEVLRGDRQIDLLLTDVIMPGMVGPQLVEHARALRPDLKVLYMSGYSDRELSRRARNSATAGSYIGKPYTARQLLTSVAAVLSGADQPLDGGGVLVDRR